MIYSNSIIERISVIRAEPNVEKRLEELKDLNESLPRSIRLDMPSLITNAYVRKALDVIEDRITMISTHEFC